MIGRVFFDEFNCKLSELPPTPGIPRFLQQKRPGEMTITFSRPQKRTSSTRVSAFLVQWIESRNFLADYLVSLSPEIATAIQPSQGGLFTHPTPAGPVDKESALNQVNEIFFGVSGRQ